MNIARNASMIKYICLFFTALISVLISIMFLYVAILFAASESHIPIYATLMIWSAILAGIATVIFSIKKSCFASIGLVLQFVIIWLTTL